MIKHFVPRVIRRLGLAPRVIQLPKIVVNGSAFRLPLIGTMGYANMSLSEPWMTSMLAALAPIFDLPNAVFVDVGVNIGQTLLKLRSVAKSMRYVGFEPNPACVHYVTELMKVNSFGDVSLYPFGISRQAQVLELQFYNDEDLDSCASIVEGFRPDQAVVRRMFVPTFPVSEIRIDGKVTLLKIDVEGGEWEVIQGMEDLISRDKPIISMEILPAYNESNVERIQRQRSIEELLKRLGYQCNRVRIGSHDSFQGIGALSRIEIHGNIALSEYLWVPQELMPRVTERLALVKR